MDRSKLRAIVDVHVPELIRFLGLDDWRVFVAYERLEGTNCAEIVAEVDYRQATIKLDIDHLDDDLLIVDILFHELAHILLSPFNIYREISGQMIPDNVGQKPNSKVEIRAWAHACEGGVLALERLWRNYLRDIYLNEMTGPG